MYLYIYIYISTTLYPKDSNLVIVVDIVSQKFEAKMAIFRPHEDPFKIIIMTSRPLNTAETSM